MNYLVMVCPNGYFIWINGPFAGRDNDRAAFNQTVFAQETCSLLSPGEYILCDGGFRGPGHIIHQFVETDLQGETGEDLHEMLLFNEEFDLNRARVEAAIGKLKRRAQALSKKYPREPYRQADLLFAAAKLLNYLRDLRYIQALNQVTDMDIDMDIDM